MFVIAAMDITGGGKGKKVFDFFYRVDII